MPNDAARRARTFYQDISGNLTLTAATDDTVLVTAKNTNYTLFIQRVIFTVTTDAAQSISFEDTAGSPVRVCKVPTSPGVDTRWEFDFGAAGYPLTSGKNFNMNVSAVGLAGHLEWYGYQKLNNGVAVGST